MMLSENELFRLYVQQNIPLIGRKAVETIRSSDPVRRVGGGTHNVATRFASRKMGCVIQAESHKGELPAVYSWEHDPKTFEFYDQPSKVKLSYQNGPCKRVSHLSTPDYFLIQEHWMGWVECKPEEELQKSFENGNQRYVPDGKDRWRCPPGEEFAAQFGLGFQVRSTCETNWILVRNLEFLSDYLDSSCPEPTEADRQNIMRAFAGSRWLLLKDLLNGGGVNADSVFRLIAAQEILVDLEKELLSEPIFTHVCRDTLSAEVYRYRKLNSTPHAAIPLKAVQLATGFPVLWDGNPWRILNVGNDDVYLEDSNHAISNLRLEAFQNLVASGAICGVPEEIDERHRLAEEALKRAAPIDLEQATRRVRLLNQSDAGDAPVPARTLRYWRNKARQGEIAYDNSFAGVLPRISARGNRERKVMPAVVDIMNEVIETEVLAPQQAKITSCYGKVVNLCRERGLPCPSDKTFRAEIKRRREVERVLARQGRRAAYSLSDFQWRIDQSTPRHGERPFEIGHIDHTELDIELVDSRTGANLGRPWLTVLLDAYARTILAFFLTFDPPSYRSCMAVLRNAVKGHGRITSTIVVDQGSDFESIYFEALLARLKCHKKSRPAAKARFGSVIERFFGVNNQTFIHNLVGNSQALQRPRSMSPSHDPRTLAVWTLPALTAAFEEFAFETYAGLIHPALGISPKEMMALGLAQSGCRSHLLIPYTEDFVRLCMPTTPARKARVRHGRGIKIRNIHYWHPIFREPTVEGSSVDVLYDPFDISRAYALVYGEWRLCRSEYQSMFERRTEREIILITQEIRALHSLYGIARRTNAGDVATFLTKIRESETVLRQQRRDAERQVTEGEPSSALLESPIQQLPDSNTESKNAWSTPVTIEIFEELK